MTFGNSPTATIHLNHIRENFSVAKAAAPRCKTMVVIKANAYGHGMPEVARVLDDADSYAVARVAEGVALRQAVPELAHKPIAVLEGFLGEAEMQACLAFNLTPVVHCHTQLECLAANLPFWLKFNTGMYRLGFHPREAEQVLHQIREKSLTSSLLGLVTHLANSDDPDHELNPKQLASIQHVAEQFPATLPLSVTNSGGILGLPDFQSDWIRPGLMLYGGSPTGIVNESLKPGMTLTAPILTINELSPGDAVGYGGHWVAERECRIAVVAMGYADGYPREMPAGTPVAIAGRQRQLVGRVSMDMCTVLLAAEDDFAPGEQVEFWGEQIFIDEIADRVGTISYTLMTGLGNRVNRVYSTG